MKKRNIENNIFKDSLNLINESKKNIYLVIMIFFLSGLFGFIFADKLTFINEILKELVDKTKGLDTFELIVFIFLNNLQSAFLGMILGLAFGIMPLVNSIGNGVVLGFVFEKVYGVSGLSDFWRILPHGIFELPAIFIALGLGVSLGSKVCFQNDKKGVLYNLKRAILAFLCIVLPLLIIAAIIEGLLIGFAKT